MSVDLTRMTRTSVSVDLTRMTRTSVSVDLTRMTRTSVSVDLTRMTRMSVSVDLTRMTRTSVSVDLIRMTRTSVSVDLTRMTRTSVSVDLTRMTRTSVSVDPTRMTRTSVSVDLTRMTRTSVSVDLTRMTRTSVSVDLTRMFPEETQLAWNEIRASTCSSRSWKWLGSSVSIRSPSFLTSSAASSTHEETGKRFLKYLVLGGLKEPYEVDALLPQSFHFHSLNARCQLELSPFQRCASFFLVTYSHRGIPCVFAVGCLSVNIIVVPDAIPNLLHILRPAGVSRSP